MFSSYNFSDSGIHYSSQCTTQNQNIQLHMRYVLQLVPSMLDKLCVLLLQLRGNQQIRSSVLTLPYTLQLPQILAALLPA